jgi:hypothetical protein
MNVIVIAEATRYNAEMPGQDRTEVASSASREFLEEEAASNVRQLYRKSRSGSVALPYR